MFKRLSNTAPPVRGAILGFLVGLMVPALILFPMLLDEYLGELVFGISLIAAYSLSIVASPLVIALKPLLSQVCQSHCDDLGVTVLGLMLLTPIVYTLVGFLLGYGSTRFPITWGSNKKAFALLGILLGVYAFVSVFAFAISAYNT